MDTRKYVQGQDYQLSGSGITATATSITITSMYFPQNVTLVTMTDFGTLGSGTIEPETEREENFTFTGITQNGNGTATFTGVTRGMRFNDPYTQDITLRQAHAGGTTLRITNTVQMYSDFCNKQNDETIAGIYTFTDPNVPRMDATHAYLAGEGKYFATKEYVDSVAVSGAPNADTTTKGIVQEATQAQVDARTTTGSTGARLYPNPSTLRTVLSHDYAADAGVSDAYAITCVPAVTTYATGDIYTFKANTANTGAATLAVNGLAAKAIVKNASEALITGDIIAGQIVQVVYDGTNMQLQVPVKVTSSAGAADTGKSVGLDANGKLSTTFGTVPIGAIISWAKSLAGVPALGTSFVECNGQVLADAQSPLNGSTIPNLNASGGGTQRFLRGSTTSGTTGGEETHTMTLGELVAHTHTAPVTSSAGAGTTGVQRNNDNGGTTNSTGSTGTTTPFNVLPSYYEVVWVMRIK